MSALDDRRSTPAGPRPAQEGRRFRQALAGGPRARGEGDPDLAASVAALAGWFRAEPPRVSPSGGAVAPSRGIAAPDRVLVGQNAGVAEARIRIGTGAFAGAEIRLQSSAGSQAIEAELLTSSEGSRQTLAVAMDEIRTRLGARGIALVPAPDRRPGSNGNGQPRGANPPAEPDR
jgi:hypothetical protein